MSRSIQTENATAEKLSDDHITGPYVGFDRYGNPDHEFWVCEACGDEATRRSDLEHDCTGGY